MADYGFEKMIFSSRVCAGVCAKDLIELSGADPLFPPIHITLPVTSKVWAKWSLLWALPMFKTPLAC